MASVGEELIFRCHYYDRSGNPGDPTTVTGKVLEPDEALHNLVLTPVAVGVYEAPYLITKEGEHWVRITGTGAIKAAIEKKFEVVKQRVPS